MIIGIDVGTRSAGIAALDDNGKLLWSKQLSVGGKSLDDRLYRLNAEIFDAVVDSAMATDVYAYIEQPPYVQNHKTHAALNQAVGAVKTALMDAMVVPGISELTATEIKACFAGKGKATKADVQSVAKMQFGGDYGEDEADAIAVAYTGWCKWKEGRDADSA